MRQLFSKNKILLLMLSLAYSSFSSGVETTFNGAGWFQFGMVQESFAPGESNNYNGNVMQNAGGVLIANAKINEYWTGVFSVGAVQVHLARGSISQTNNLYPFIVPFVGEASLSYTAPLFLEDDKLNIKLGSFGYNYNPSVKNLGLYLLKGYVYPGTLVSGFGDLFGALFSYKLGMFTNDLIFNIETEDKPLYDISVADYLGIKLHSGFEIGFGVNFYRAIPNDPSVTSPDLSCDVNKDMGRYANQGQDNPCWIQDTVFAADSSVLSIDSIPASLAGTKLIFHWKLDPKAFFGIEEPFGPDDLVLYGEGALIGVKDYPVVYDKKSERMPIMFGINFPGFNFIKWAFELEYYGSLNSADNIAAQYGSPVPVVNSDYNNKRDNWKWAFKASKVFSGNLEFSAQIANDHLRIGGNHNDATGVEVVTTPKDWYWTTKLAYFF